MSETSETPSFGEAMEELEGILRRVEGEEIDIDELAQQLQRAAGLLELCRRKIRRAEVEVSQIVQGLEEPPGSGADEPEPDEAPDRPEQDAMF